MQGRISSHIRSNVVGYLALFCFALYGTADALPGRNTVDSGDIANGKVKSADVRDNGLTGTDIDESTLDGVRGAQGPTGAQGPPGEQGEAGADGSADTPQEVLAKLLDVDGTGSGLDADTLDGVDSTGFLAADTTFSGDVSGPASALALGNNTVGALEAFSEDEIRDGTVDAEDIDEASLTDLTKGRSTELVNPCNPVDATFVSCRSLALDLPRSGRALVIVTGGWFSGDGTPAGGRCKPTLDGVDLTNGTRVGGPARTSDKLGGYSETVVTGPLTAGTKTFELVCNEDDADFVVNDGTISAVMLSAG